VRQRGWRLLVLKTFDRIAAAVGIVAISPLLAVVAIAVRVTMGSPVLFRQRRAGLRGAPFDVLKFRTMLGTRDQEGNLLPDGERMTRLGSFLRSSSLDELPQLANVLRGEMSLVGPRPLVVLYLSRYDAEQARRHDVLPGITGWQQVKGRNALQWEERLALDVWYVDHWSLLLDLKILALTPLVVLRGRGVSHEGHATMPYFMGTLASESVEAQAPEVAGGREPRSEREFPLPSAGPSQPEGGVSR
jgi:lipopolysaccharide/colanic/teichoic acid biosynthesis glycosyltransferase